MEISSLIMGIKKSRGLMFSVCCLVFILSTPAAARFKCTSTRPCTAIIDYVSPNKTTLSTIIALFNVTSLHSFLGVNDLPVSTLTNRSVASNQTVKIPIPCICSNGTGKSNHIPVYKVVPDDGLYHIAAEVFSGLVTYPEIQEVNNISDANKIEVGQELWIPLPCSCDDDLPGQRVIHYGYVVPGGSTVEGIAQRFNTSQDVLLRLNNLITPKDLKAGAVLDVPLRACTSTIREDSPDYPLLVPNGTYTMTAKDCVMCTCNAANNWMLQCDPSPLRSSLSCPSMQQCPGNETRYLGNTISSGCNRTSCSYAGFTNQTILTTVSSISTCPASDNNASAVMLHGWRWNLVVIAFHLMLLLIHLA